MRQAIRNILLSGAPAFNPAQLFRSGEQGAWYDPSDLTTLYQDSAGTTPVTAVEQPVGLMLDKSKSGGGTNGAKRVNLLTYTEQFDNAVWVKSVTTVAVNETAAPDGTLTADGLIGNSGATINTGVYQTNAVDAIKTFSIYAKAGDKAWIRLYGNNLSDGIYFNLTTGGTGSTVGSPVSYSITGAGNGWYKCSLTFNHTTGVTNPIVGIYFTTNNGSSASSGDGTTISGYLWGADLRLASEAATIPTYQKIVADWPSTLAGNHASQSTTTARPVLSARKNMLVGTATLSTQTATTIAGPHVLSFWGTGSVTLSGTATGTLTGTGVNDRVYLEFTATAGTLTLTVSGSVTKAQLEMANEKV